MELAHNKNLGVFSLSEVQWCQSTAAYAKSNSRASDTPGSGAAASYLCCQIPQLCFSRSCSCLQLAVIPASCQWRWQHFPQPFPQHHASLKAKANSILLLYVCALSCRHIWFLFGVYVVWTQAQLKLIPTAGRKRDITYICSQSFTQRWNYVKHD